MTIFKISKGGSPSNCELGQAWKRIHKTRQEQNNHKGASASSETLLGGLLPHVLKSQWAVGRELSLHWGGCFGGSTNGKERNHLFEKYEQRWRWRQPASCWTQTSPCILYLPGVCAPGLHPLYGANVYGVSVQLLAYSLIICRFEWLLMSYHERVMFIWLGLSES